MGITILYVCVSIAYIFFVCLDGEDIKPKWKQYLDDKLGVKPKVVLRYVDPEIVRVCSRVEISRYYWMNYNINELYMKQCKEEAMEVLYNGILKEMIKNDLIHIQQHKDPINGSVVYEAMCNIYKEIKHQKRI